MHDMAARMNLHSNTARFHLDSLVELGLAERGREDATRPGRPRTVYQATSPDKVTGQRSYRLLAEMLTSLITSILDQPSHTARQAGQAWGRYLVDRPAPSQRVTTADAVDRLTRMLTDAGFGVEEAGDTDNPVLALRHCPFREVAEGHRDVVCSLHLGMLQGALNEVHPSLAAETLEPFVEPSLCRAPLTHTGEHPHRMQLSEE